MTAKLLIDIESLLSNTYRDELPKRERDGGSHALGPTMHPMWRMGLFGGRVDNWTREPGFPAAMGECDPDALIVEMEVQALRQFALTDVAGDILAAGLDVPDAAIPPVLERASRAASILVGMHAKMGTRPGVGEVQVEPVRLPGNRSVGTWRQGFVSQRTILGDEIRIEVEIPAAASRKKYPDGTYCKLAFSPSPAHVLLERAEYLVWRASLRKLADALDGQLRQWVVTDCAAPTAPWLTRMPVPANPARSMAVA